MKATTVMQGQDIAMLIGQAKSAKSTIAHALINGLQGLEKKRNGEIASKYDIEVAGTEMFQIERAVASDSEYPSFSKLVSPCQGSKSKWLVEMPGLDHDNYVNISILQHIVSHSSNVVFMPTFTFDQLDTINKPRFRRTFKNFTSLLNRDGCMRDFDTFTLPLLSCVPKNHQDMSDKIQKLFDQVIRTEEGDVQDEAVTKLLTCFKDNFTEFEPVIDENETCNDAFERACLIHVIKSKLYGKAGIDPRENLSRDMPEALAN